MDIKNINNDSKPHFVLVPFMALGHMISMVEMAQILVDRGAQVSFITTPINATRIKPILDNTNSNMKFIHIVEFAFPWKEFGLPEGCESIDLISSIDHCKRFFESLRALAEPVKVYIREVTPSVTCIISDYCNYFTAEVSQALHIPWISFSVIPCFSTYVLHFTGEHNSFHSVGEFDSITVTDLPKKIEVTKVEVLGAEWFKDYGKAIVEAHASALGMVVNTCYELETDIIDHFEKLIRKKVWPIGPLCLCNKDVDSKANRGMKSFVDETQVMNWLDSYDPKSVIYVSFGSQVQNKTAQLIEVGIGLEKSNVPFIWVIKETERTSELEKWMGERFEERTKERGLVITGWAPQQLILSHPSIGGVVTQCGWNSVQEAIVAGLPMLTWPHFGDHFLNEKFILEFTGIGVAVGVEKPVWMFLEDEVAVRSEAVEKAVVRLMDTGEEGEDRRRRATEYAEKLKRTMEEGGSSWKNLTMFMDYIMEGVKIGY